MKITSKSRYSLKLMMDIALCEMQEEHVKRADLAKRQDIPLDYLDQILMKLRQAGLLESCRGRIGGYNLAKSASDITVKDIFSAVEEQWSPVSCANELSRCALEDSCIAHDAWQDIIFNIHSCLDQIKLSQLCHHSAHKHRRSRASKTTKMETQQIGCH